MQRAFRAICAEEGFEEYLEDTLQRIADIESLGRTREIVAKDLVLGGKYVFESRKGWGGGRSTVVSLLEKEEEKEEGGDDEGDGKGDEDGGDKKVGEDDGMEDK